MSDTDSFIDEVNEEVRRDRLYFMLRRYGWIAGLAVVIIVGGAAWSEYRKAQAAARAQALGDSILASLEQNDAAARLENLESVDAETAGAEAVLALLQATEAQQAGDAETATDILGALAVNGEVPDIYRQIAAFKSLVIGAETLPDATRRQQLEALANPGSPLALLAQEQLALMDINAGETQRAIDTYQSIMQSAGVSSGLQQRALQAIVALGGTPEVSNLPDVAN